MRIRNWFFAVAFLAAGLGSEAARAELVTFRATGFLFSAANTQQIGLDDARPGDAFTIDYTFESSTPGINPVVLSPVGETPQASADYLNAVLSMVWTVNGRSFTQALVFPHIRITNDATLAFPFDQYLQYDQYIVCGVGCIYLESNFRAFSPSGVTSLALPVTPPNVNSFDAFQAAFYLPDPNDDPSTVVLVGRITSIELSPVPLPAAAPLLALGLAGFAAFAARRSRRAAV